MTSLYVIVYVVLESISKCRKKEEEEEEKKKNSRRSLRRRAFTEIQSTEFRVNEGFNSSFALGSSGLVSSDSRASETEVRYEDYQVICEALIAEARQRGSNDDCSVCVLLFQ